MAAAIEECWKLCISMLIIRLLIIKVNGKVKVLFFYEITS